MKPEFIDVLICPTCHVQLASTDAELHCGSCDKVYPIVRGVPRFVDNNEDYAENFGVQWQRFRTLQVDRLAGHKLSTTRFLADTGWGESLKGQLVLDAGCGAGRFSDVLAEFGANVVACDLSSAVDACRQNVDDRQKANLARGDVLVMQANLTELPLKPAVFDAVYCAGVIQHTHAPDQVMRALIKYVKPGGQLFFNFYEKSTFSRLQLIKYTLRRWTPFWPINRLHRFCRALCAIFFWPSLVLSRLPLLRQINRLLPICSVLPRDLSIELQKQLTLLDTIDWYGPRYEYRQNHEIVAQLLRDEGMVDVRSDPGRVWGRQAE